MYFLILYYTIIFLQIVMKVATPAEIARTEDPGLSIAREEAEVVPAESVHRNENQPLHRSKKLSTSLYLQQISRQNELRNHNVCMHSLVLIHLHYNNYK